MYTLDCQIDSISRQRLKLIEKYDFLNREIFVRPLYGTFSLVNPNLWRWRRRVSHQIRRIERTLEILLETKEQIKRKN